MKTKTLTRMVTAYAQGSAEEAVKAVELQLRAQIQDSPIAFMIAFASTTQPLNQVLPRLQAAFDTKILAASTAGEFSHQIEGTGRLVVSAVLGDMRVSTGMGHSVSEEPQVAVNRALAGVVDPNDDYPHRTAIVFVDSLAYSGEEITLLVASQLGQAQIVGAAAADDLQVQRTFVGCGPTAASDAIAVAVLDTQQPLGIGLCHGHEPLSGELKVTRSEGSRVFELDGKPAWLVWRDLVRDSALQRWSVDVDQLERAHALQVFARYEAGLEGVAGDYKVRAPLVLNEDHSINFTCGMPEGTVLKIMEASTQGLVDSAREAARRASEAVGGPLAGALVFDCAVRRIALDDAFRQATTAITSQLAGTPLAGMEAYGEIAMNVGEMSGFHNSATVVLAFPGN